jgi:hypothetical protein
LGWSTSGPKISASSSPTTLARLARHLNVARQHPTRVLLEAARLARKHGVEDGRPAAEWYFELLESWHHKEVP